MPTTPLTDAERTDARRFCGYPAYGPGASGFQNWRYFAAYGTLEYRLTNITDSEVAVLRTYLTTLAGLETGITGAAANLDTDRAAVWVRNRDEVRDRARLFDDWRRRLCGFIGVPPGPALERGVEVVI